MKKKVFLTLSLLTSAVLAGSPTLAAPSDSAPSLPSQSQPAPDTQPQTTPSQPQPLRRTTPSQGLPQTTPSQPSVSSGLLTKEDLPPGFQEVPPELKTRVVSQLTGFLQQQLPGANLKAEKLFGFFNPQTSEVVMGYTDQLPDQSTQGKFDSALKQIQQPDTQKKLLSQLQEKVKNVKDYKVEIVDFKSISQLNNLADSSAGVSVNLKVESQPVLANIVTFRRKKTVAIASVVNLNGQQPAVQLSDIARKLDTRMSSSASAAHF